MQSLILADQTMTDLTLQDLTMADQTVGYCYIAGHIITRTISICYMLADYRFLNVIRYPNSRYFTYLLTYLRLGTRGQLLSHSLSTCKSLAHA